MLIQTMPPNVTSPDELYFGAQVSIIIRWLLLVLCVVESNYRVNYGGTAQILNTLYSLMFMAANGYVFYLIRTRGKVNPYWMLGLSALDLIAVVLCMMRTGGHAADYTFILYPNVAMFAVIFISTRMTLAWVTMVALVYLMLRLNMGDGLNFEEHDERTVAVRIFALYAVAAVVNMIMRFERTRRQRAIEHEIQRERVELSQRIHDTAAQTAYMVGLGIDSAIDLLDDGSEPVRNRLEATSRLARSAMWDLRQPIEIGGIFEGAEIAEALASHSAIFTSITGVPVNMSVSGREPPLSMKTRGILFSIAHNALTNVFRHAQADGVTIELVFNENGLRMSISDDGVGLPEDYERRGHGFGNMRSDAERIGGTIEVRSDQRESGTRVVCLVPYGPAMGGAECHWIRRQRWCSWTITKLCERD